MDTQNKTIKVVQIASGDLWAGAEVQLHTLCKGLLKLDVDVHAIIFNEGELANKLIEAGVAVTVLPESEHSFFSLLQKTHSILKQLQPDAIHTHRQKENIIGSIANLFSGRTVCVRTIHGDNEHAFQWHKPQRALQKWLDRFCGRYLQDAIIAVTKQLAEQLSVVYPSQKVHTIHNGIDIDICSQLASTTPPMLSLAKNAHHIGIVGRLVSVKRQDLFLATAQRLIQDHRSQRWHFHIIGSGPLEAALKTQAQECKISEHVTFHGHLSPACKAIAELDALLICSDHEGLPMTLLEAMTVKTCVVAHNTGGMEEILEHGKNAILVDKHKAAAYAKAIASLFETSSIKATLENNAEHEVSQAYTAQSNVKKTVSLYGAKTHICQA